MLKFLHELSILCTCKYSVLQLQVLLGWVGSYAYGILLHKQLVLIVTGTVTDVPQTSPHLVSGVIIVYVIDNTALLQQEWYGHWIRWTFK
jgi:ABC-type sulfate transport system permease component